MKQLISFFLFLVVLAVFITSCNANKGIINQELERSFVIGSGGGITGAYDVYRIYNTGKIEKQNRDNENYSLFKTIPKDSAISVFKALDSLAIGSYMFNHPGNMTYFIEITNVCKLNTVKWGSANHPIREDIEFFFQRIRKMIRADYE